MTASHDVSIVHCGPRWYQILKILNHPPRHPPQPVLKTSSWISCATLVARCRMAMASPTEFACRAGRTSQQAEPKNLTEKLWQKQRNVADFTPPKESIANQQLRHHRNHWVGLRDLFSWTAHDSSIFHGPTIPTATKNQDKSLVRHVENAKGPGVNQTTIPNPSTKEMW